MSLPTPCQSLPHKQFHQCVNHKIQLCLRHPLPNFGTFSFFQASILLGVDRVLKKLTKLYKSELKHLCQCCILIPRKCPHKPHFNTQCPPLPPFLKLFHNWKLMFDLFKAVFCDKTTVRQPHFLICIIFHRKFFHRKG